MTQSLVWHCTALEAHALALTNPHSFFCFDICSVFTSDGVHTKTRYTNRLPRSTFTNSRHDTLLLFLTAYLLGVSAVDDYGTNDIMEHEMPF